ncbi:histidinol-phosphate aminotransferase [Haloechinothrix alba]|uniref:Aromatic amino acid aminotransferase n=1 Tax=Haloechinothrix alba TaxID=664784 RepID=A0A239AD96_9PSEU|nr:histidinol-phosphate transaminase [Haloechinothrix alba]SNR93575.1 histidinol-phosphate aminotransferase [Haloechinothrix alba]
MPASPRADLDSLPPYVPGKSVPGAIKLASNEVPLAPLPSVADTIAQATSSVNRYPDMGSYALLERLSTGLGVPQQQVAVGCGSVSLCQQVMQAMCNSGDEVLFAWRSFEAYPILAQVVGVRQRTVPLDEHHVHDLDAMLDAITPETRVVFVCNPNNPTGTVVRTAALERFLDAVPSHVLVVLDEAYAEFVNGPDVPDGLRLVAERDNVAVCRTFSKAYGLAGLRVGYLVGQPTIVEAVRKTCIPFSVNALAQAAAVASLDAADELLSRCADISRERDRVRAALLDQGYAVPESMANFVWLPLGDRAAEFAEHALANKVVVRPFAGDGVRVTIGTPEENDTLLEATRTF